MPKPFSIFIEPQQHDPLPEALGSGLSNLLQGLAENRAKQVRHRQTSSALQALFNLDPEIAQQAAYAPESVLKEYAKQKSQQPQWEQEASFLNALLSQQQSGNQNTVNLPNTSMLKPGQALPIAKYLQSQQQHQQDFAQRQKQFNIGTLQPKFAELQNRYNDINNKLQTYQQLSELNKSNLERGLFGFGKPSAETQEFESLLESLVPAGATEAQLESARKRLPTLKQSPAVRQKLIDYNLKRLNAEIAQIQKQAQGLNYKDSLSAEVVSPNEDQVFNQILNEAQGSPLQKLEQAQSPVMKSQVANEQSQQPQEQPLINLSEVGKTAGHIANKALRGIGHGIVGLPTLPFNLLNLLSLGNIPIPETVKKIQDLPDKTVDQLFGEAKPQDDTAEFLGNWTEDIASILTPGGLLGKVGKLTKLDKVNKIAKFLNTTPKAAAAISGAGNLAKLGVQKIGNGTEKEGDVAKAATMFMMPIVGGRFINKKIDSLSNQASELAKNSFVKAPNFIKDNHDFYNALTGGAATKEKTDLIKSIEPLLQLKAAGTFNVGDVINMQKAVTQASNNTQFLTQMRNALPKYNAGLNETLKKASESNSSYGEIIKEMNDLINATRVTNNVNEFAKKHIGAQRYKNPLTWALTGYIGKELTGLPTYKALGAVAIPGLTLGEAHRFMKLMLTNSTFNKVYSKYLNAAAIGNIKEGQKYARALDHIISKEDKE